MRLSELFPRDKLQNLSSSDWRRRLILDKGAQVKGMRGCVNRLIGFADRQGILDTEMLARLGSEDYDQFQSAIHELAVAEFLSPIGGIEWHPPGRGSRIGEFRVVPTKHAAIFVEVKTIFISADESIRDRNWDVLREISHSILSPFRITIEFLNLQGDVVPRRFRAWLQRQLTYLRGELTQPYQERELIFSDSSEDGSVVEVKVEFVRWCDDDLPTACDRFSGVKQIDLHQRVIKIIDGALKKLPDNQPTLVVIASTAWVGLNERVMLAAMLSFPKVTVNIGTAPRKHELTVHYDLQGIVQSSIRTRLGAVGVWKHKWTKDPRGSLDIYHNPLRAREISYHILELPNVCQLIPKGEGTMEWMPKRPSE